MGSGGHFLPRTDNDSGNRLMAEIISLRMARKARTRADKAGIAAANRALHGETKAHKDARKAEAARAARLLDGHERGTD